MPHCSCAGWRSAFWATTISAPPVGSHNYLTTAAIPHALLSLRAGRYRCLLLRVMDAVTNVEAATMTTEGRATEAELVKSLLSTFDTASQAVSPSDIGARHIFSVRLLGCRRGSCVGEWAHRQLGPRLAVLSGERGRVVARLNCRRQACSPLCYPPSRLEHRSLVAACSSTP